MMMIHRTRKWAMRLSLILASPIMATPIFAQQLVTHNRIPQKYFVTSGAGQTDQGAGNADPWETGAWDIAERVAGIADYNVMTYSSIIPPEAIQISREEGATFFHHGAVMEAIIAAVNGKRDETLTTGVGRIFVRRRADNRVIGGFAAEYEQRYPPGPAIPESQAIAAAEAGLTEALDAMMARRYDPAEYEFFGRSFQTNYVYVNKAYGTSLSAICWVTTIYPIIESSGAVPAVSTWGVVILALLLLTASRFCFGRRKPRTTS